MERNRGGAGYRPNNRRGMSNEFGTAFGGLSLGGTTRTGDTAANGFSYGDCRYCGSKQPDHMPSDCPEKSEFYCAQIFE